jgi:hypothetical protein
LPCNIHFIPDKFLNTHAVATLFDGSQPSLFPETFTALVEIKSHLTQKKCWVWVDNLRPAGSTPLISKSVGIDLDLLPPTSQAYNKLCLQHNNLTKKSTKHKRLISCSQATGGPDARRTRREERSGARGDGVWAKFPGTSGKFKLGAAKGKPQTQTPQTPPL